MELKTSLLLSSISGYISILFWLIVFLPQLKENYIRRNGDGLSLTFLCIWLAGDLFNLAGIIMEDLMFTMFLLALWYTIADIGLIWQVIYYKECVTKEIKSDSDEAIALVNQKQLKQRRFSTDKEGEYENGEISLIHPYNENDGADTTGLLLMSIPPKIKPIWVNLFGSVILIALVFLSCFGFMKTGMNDTTEEEIQVLPQILGWCSCGLYIGSRIPQLLKNWREQSTEGLSSGMFICAVFGNLFFAASIFLKSTERRYIIINLSWIIGSLGTVIFDIMIFAQFYTFNRRKLKRNRAD